jgi:anaerobic magnesium-protoporphyrin IX monomethyl ester cyclase
MSSKQTKIHLTFSPPLLKSRYEVLSESTWPPLGVLYLASYIRSRTDGIDVRVTDGCKVGYAATVEDIKKSDPDIIGISFLTTTAHGALQLARDARRLHPKALIVMGGPHATALPVETLKESGADIVVAGEGEEALCQIAELAKAGKKKDDFASLPGVCLESKGQIRRNDPAPFIVPLDSIPFPAWDLIDIKSYRGWYLSKQSPEVSVLFSRGCPYLCTFCSNCVWKSSKPAVRLRSPQNIADEIEYLATNFGVREVFDNSDEFNCNLGHSLDVCREIKRRHLGVAWKTQLRATPFTEELAKELAEAGCWYVHLGIESGNQATLDGIEKHIKLEDIEPTCRLLKKYGIRVLALFMLFNVWETDGQLVFEDAPATENTLRFARALARKRLIDYLGWSVATPYPGSRLYDIALRHGLVRSSFAGNWETWQQEGLFVMDLPGITGKDRRKVKLKGELLRATLMLRARAFKLKDVLFLLRRAAHIAKYSSR